MPSTISKTATLFAVALMATGCARSPRPKTETFKIASRSPAIAPIEDRRSVPVRHLRTVRDSPSPTAQPNELETPTSKIQLASAKTPTHVAAEAMPVELPVKLPGERPAYNNPLHSGSGFTLDGLISIALAANPAIAQAELAAAQAAAVYSQVGLKPNPSVGYFGQEIGNEGAGGQHGVFASQTIVRGDKLRWNRCVTSHEVNRFRWEAEAQRRRVETDVRIRFYRALAAQQRLQKAVEFRTNPAKAVDVAKRRLGAKEGTKPDLLQSQLLVDQIDLSIRQSELALRAAWTELAATIGQPSLPRDELVGDFVGEELADMTTLYEEALAASPQLSAARARIDRARTNLQRQRIQAVPNLNVQLGVGIDDSTDDTFASAQVGVPIPVHNRNQGNIAAAQSEFAAASQNLQRLSLQLKRDMAEVFRRYQDAAVTIEKYDTTMLPRAEEALALVEEAYNSGEIEFLRVLTARQTVFELQQELISARAELSQARAEIDGYMLTNALGTEVAFEGDDSLRGQALSGQ